jgi:hypothetical protein
VRRVQREALKRLIISQNLQKGEKREKISKKCLTKGRESGRIMELSARGTLRWNEGERKNLKKVEKTFEKVLDKVIWL